MLNGTANDYPPVRARVRLVPLADLEVPDTPASKLPLEVVRRGDGKDGFSFETVASVEYGEVVVGLILRTEEAGVYTAAVIGEEEAHPIHPTSGKRKFTIDEAPSYVRLAALTTGMLDRILAQETFEATEKAELDRFFSARG